MSTPNRRTTLAVSPHRLQNFSDAIFAIAITLLVLDITVPAVTTQHVSRALLSEWPVYLAYTVSFASIGAAWLSHNLITEYLDHADSILLRLNLLLMFFVSLLPFPTHLLANFLSQTGPERVAVTIYGLNLFLITSLTSLVWHYAARNGHIRAGMPESERRTMSRKIDPSLAFYVFVLGVGLLEPRIAVTLYLLIALFIMLPFRTLVAHYTGQAK